MPIVALRDFRSLVPLTAHDGETGVVVRLHWSRWLRFWAVAPVVTLGLPYVLYLVVTKGIIAPWGLAAIVSYVIVGYAVTHVGWFWYRILKGRFLLFTEASLFDHRIEDLIRPVTDTYKLEKVAGVKFESEGWGILGVRTVRVQIEGDAKADPSEETDGQPGVVFIHAGGGKALENEINGIQDRPNP